jgi:hypothetical protein
MNFEFTVLYSGHDVKICFFPVNLSFFFLQKIGYNYLKLSTYASELSNFKLDGNSIDRNVNCAKTKLKLTMSMLLVLNSSQY